MTTQKQGKISFEELDNSIIPLGIPTGFLWIENFLKNKLYKNSNKIYTTFTNEIQDLGKIYYVNNVTGSDANDGLTIDTPLKRMTVALAKIDVNTIVLDGTRQYYVFSMNGTPIDKSINIITYGNTKSATLNYSYIPFAKTVGQTNVWEATVANIGTVVDLITRNVDGDLLEYQNVIDLATCDSTPYSYYESGGTLYVNRDGTQVEGDISVVYDTIDVFDIDLVSGVEITIENLEFLGAVNITGEGTVFFKNCSFNYAQNGSGLKVNSDATVVLENCKAVSNTDNGFAYFTGSKAIEINCKGYKNGSVAGGGTNNGSTGHGNCKIIRLNGEYYENRGPNIADVQDGCQSWNLGCISRDSSLGSGSTQDVDFQAKAEGGTTDMWLEKCDSAKSESGFSLFTNEANVYIKNNNLLTVSTLNGGTINRYV